MWFLTGFWHGAAWNFIIWGLYFAVLLLIEKIFLGKFLDKHHVFGHIYTIIFVIISFVIFNCNSLSEVHIYLSSMFGISKIPFINYESLYYFKSYAIILIIAIIGCTPLMKNVFNKYSKYLSYIEPILCIIGLIVVTSFLIDSSFNPFLYFRF